MLATTAVVPVRTDLVVVLRRFGSAAARRLVTYATLDRQALGRRAVGRGSGFVLGRTEAQQR